LAYQSKGLLIERAVIIPASIANEKNYARRITKRLSQIIIGELSHIIYANKTAESSLTTVREDH
jgi:hypothetical protein